MKSRSSRTAANAQDTLAPATSAPLKARIDAVRQRAIAGEDFAALVKEVSDSATKANGGLIGPINVRDLNPATKALLDQSEAGRRSPSRSSWPAGSRS